MKLYLHKKFSLLRLLRIFLE